MGQRVLNMHFLKSKIVSRLAAAAVLATLVFALPAPSFAGIFLSVNIGPPALPVYVQPPCPAPGYMWTPGYWAYGPEGYFWVPGTWVVAPTPGFLWTPGYWGWGGGVFLWHAGYWGPHIGFYGGVNYGFGYGGVGFEGGFWNHGVFNYNRSVTNVNVNVTNVYNKTVINNNSSNVSFNGGTGGIQAQPNQQELQAEHEQHVQPTQLQTQHEQAASTNHQLLASVNHGSPAIAATSRPGEFSGKGVVPAKAAGAPYNAAAYKNARPVAAPKAANTAAAAARPNTTTAQNRSVPKPPNAGTSHPAPMAQSSASRTTPSVPRPASQPQAHSTPASTSHASSAPKSVPHPPPAKHSQPHEGARK